MKPEFLYQLIQGLDVEQRGVFREWVAKNIRKGTGMPKFLLLYRRMLNATNFEATEIRKGHFEKPTAYYKSRELLLSKLIHCFSQKNKKDGSRFAAMETAVEMGAFDYAKVLFAQELTESTLPGASLSLLRLASFREALVQDFNVDLAAGLEIDSVLQLQAKIQVNCEAEALVVAARALFRARQGDRNAMRSTIEQFLTQPGLGWFQGSYLQQKLSIFHSYLSDEPERAAKLQILMVDQLIACELEVRNPQRLKEVSSAILSCFLLGKRDKATGLAMQFSQLPVHGLMEKRLKDKLVTLRTLELGFILGHPEITRSGISMLEACEEDLEPKFYYWYQYIAALSCLYQEDFVRGHDLIRNLLASGQAKALGMVWQLEILDLMFHLEKRNWDYLEDALVSKKRKFRASVYPACLVRYIEKLYSGEGRVAPDLLQRFKHELRSMDPDELRTGKGRFDFELYLEAKQYGIPISVLQERKDELIAIPIPG